jgi:SAM-dependent methyltransferase
VARSYRLGTLYRLESFRIAGLNLSGERVLDVGCYDGALLMKIAARLRVGADLNPRRSVAGPPMVRADACRLPFCAGSFDLAVAADVIEHVRESGELIRELIRVVEPGGRVFVTTPSAHIRLFPPFLTAWISRRWGHHSRRGYTDTELRSLVAACRATLATWNAPAFRFWYVPLRALVSLWPGLANWLVGYVAAWDAHHRTGDAGFYWLSCTTPDAGRENTGGQ